MAGTNNNVIIQPWIATVPYSMYEVTQGFTITGGTYYNPALYFSTIDNNVGNYPSGSFIYAINSYSRTNDVATVNFTYTGALPNFARGSIYAITGLPDVNMNATGMVLNAGANAGNSLFVQIINPGPYTLATSTTLGAINVPEPSWTTGFFWTPSYTTQLEIQQAVIKAQFESTYVQRSSAGIASNMAIWSLNFSDRSDKEAKGILAFVQNMAAVYSCPILIPTSSLFNNPNVKYVLANPKTNEKSYNINDLSVTATQVYEF